MRADLAAHVSLREAAAILGLAPKTLYNQLSQADPRVQVLRPFRNPGGRWRFPVAALEAAQARGRRAVTGMARRTA